MTDTHEPSMQLYSRSDIPPRSSRAINFSASLSNSEASRVTIIGPGSWLQYCPIGSLSGSVRRIFALIPLEVQNIKGGTRLADQKAIINTKLPQVGESSVNPQPPFSLISSINLSHEVVALQTPVLHLERPTDDSIKIAVGFTREVGAFLSENSPKANVTVFERFRAVLNKGRISQRVQYMIEILMKDSLNIFKFDSQYPENEDRHKSIKAEILAGDSDDESSSGLEEEDSEEDDEVAETKEGIEDRTETNLVNLCRIIYLTIMNALNYEEAVQKLLKIQIQEGQETLAERFKDPENAPKSIIEQRRAMLEADSSSSADSDTDSSSSDDDESIAGRRLADVQLRVLVVGQGLLLQKQEGEKILDQDKEIDLHLRI
ncbi:hypothetical protein BYT27DRAFT_7209637 [Phlegmacium glaucopus]|nr:hypothetical protein BYT27DRAFT_7209637 [Phlegmacium glaucopus]